MTAITLTANVNTIKLLCTCKKNFKQLFKPLLEHGFCHGLTFPLCSWFDSPCSFFPLTGMFKAFKYSRAECSWALMRLNVKVLFTEENTALWDKCGCTLWLLSHKSHRWQWLREGNWMYVNTNTNTHTFQSGSCAHLPGRDNETQTDERKAKTNGHEKD